MGEWLEEKVFGLRSYISAVTIRKGKVIPLKAWTGSEGSRRLRLPHFKTIST